MTLLIWNVGSWRVLTTHTNTRESVKKIVTQLIWCLGASLLLTLWEEEPTWKLYTGYIKQIAFHQGCIQPCNNVCTVSIGYNKWGNITLVSKWDYYAIPAWIYIGSSGGQGNNWGTARGHVIPAINIQMCVLLSDISEQLLRGKEIKGNGLITISNPLMAICMQIHQFIVKVLVFFWNFSDSYGPNEKKRQQSDDGHIKERPHLPKYGRTYFPTFNLYMCGGRRHKPPSRQEVWHHANTR